MTTKEDLKELEDYEKKLEEYNSARLQRARNKPHLPEPDKYGTTSCRCKVCERAYTNTKATNAKIKPSLEFEAMEIATKAVELLVQKHEDMQALHKPFHI